VEGLGAGSPDDTGADDYTQAERWRILRLDPGTLEVEQAYPVAGLPRGLVVAPDGTGAYVLTGAGAGSPAEGAVVHLDLATGATGWRRRGPWAGLGGLAVAAGRLYITDTAADRVAVLDRRDGRRLDTVRVGRHPLGIAPAVGG
jgi:YVTN family beta-propeller protein